MRSQQGQLSTHNRHRFSKQERRQCNPERTLRKSSPFITDTANRPCPRAARLGRCFRVGAGLALFRQPGSDFEYDQRIARWPPSCAGNGAPTLYLAPACCAPQSRPIARKKTRVRRTRRLPDLCLGLFVLPAPANLKRWPIPDVPVHPRALGFRIRRLSCYCAPRFRDINPRLINFQ